MSVARLEPMTTRSVVKHHTLLRQTSSYIKLQNLVNSKSTGYTTILFIYIFLHWRIEGGAKGALAPSPPPPPKIG